MRAAMVPNSSPNDSFSARLCESPAPIPATNAVHRSPAGRSPGIREGCRRPERRPRDQCAHVDAGRSRRRPHRAARSTRGPGGVAGGCRATGDRTRTRRRGRPLRPLARRHRDLGVLDERRQGETDPHAHGSSSRASTARADRGGALTEARRADRDRRPVRRPFECTHERGVIGSNNNGPSSTSPPPTTISSGSSTLARPAEPSATLSATRRARRWRRRRRPRPRLPPLNARDRRGMARPRRGSLACAPCSTSSRAHAAERGARRDRLPMAALSARAAGPPRSTVMCPISAREAGAPAAEASTEQHPAADARSQRDEQGVVDPRGRAIGDLAPGRDVRIVVDDHPMVCRIHERLAQRSVEHGRQVRRVQHVPVVADHPGRADSDRRARGASASTIAAAVPTSESTPK